MTVTVKEKIEVWASEDGYRGDLSCISWDKNLYDTKALCLAERIDLLTSKKKTYPNLNFFLHDFDHANWLFKKADNTKVAIVYFIYGNNLKETKQAATNIDCLTGFELSWKD